MTSKRLVAHLQGYAARVGRQVVRPTTVVGVSLLALFVNESLLFADYRLYAMLGYFLMLVVSTLGLSSFEEVDPALRGTALVAVFRLVVLGMPGFFETPFLGAAVVYGAVLPGAYILARIQPSAVQSTERKRRLVLLWFLPGLVASLLVAEFAFRTLRPTALVPLRPVANLLVTGGVLVVFAVTEELVFRRVLQRGLEARYGSITGLVLASVMYGTVFLGYGSTDAVAVGVVSGLTFGVVYDRTDSLVLVSLLHGLSNVLLFVVLPLRGSLLPV